jgi:3-deoxy-7-phosphoheptulonate synthase
LRGSGRKDWHKVLAQPSAALNTVLMILILKDGYAEDAPEVEQIRQIAAGFPGVGVRVHTIQGAERSVTEVYLIGNTGPIPDRQFDNLAFVERAFRVSEQYRQIGRHDGNAEPLEFEYQGVRFAQGTFNLFLGQCSADTPEYLTRTFTAVTQCGVFLSRLGAYKPRTSPYDFQGHGRACLPWVFELAGKFGIKIMAMEVCEERHLDELIEELERAGKPTGVMVQIGTRNAQNFALLKAVGKQHEFPVLYKRGHGITLSESLNAAEYIASEGNRKIVFCLRGVKTQLGDPHRNFADFAQVPVVKRLTRLPVCVDASHAIGKRSMSNDGILDIFHASAQGVIAGADMLITETHPEPAKALSDGPQALLPHELKHYVEDMRLVRRTYEERLALKQEYGVSA